MRGVVNCNAQDQIKLLFSDSGFVVSVGQKTAQLRGATEEMMPPGSEICTRFSALDEPQAISDITGLYLCGLAD
jgi:hypothetical protein